MRCSRLGWIFNFVEPIIHQDGEVGKDLVHRVNMLVEVEFFWNFTCS